MQLAFILFSQLAIQTALFSEYGYVQLITDKIFGRMMVTKAGGVNSSMLKQRVSASINAYSPVPAKIFYQIIMR